MLFYMEETIRGLSTLSGEHLCVLYICYVLIPSNDRCISCSSLEKKSLLRDNVDLLVTLADVYFRAGDTKNSILKFEQAQMLDPYLIKGTAENGSLILYCRYCRFLNISLFDYLMDIVS